MQHLIDAFGGVVSDAVKVLAGFGVLIFFWGLATFVLNSGDPKSHEEGRNRMVWGLITVFVMFSIWGVVSFMAATIFGHGPAQRLPNAMYGNNV